VLESPLNVSSRNNDTIYIANNELNFSSMLGLSGLHHFPPFLFGELNSEKFKVLMGSNLGNPSTHWTALFGRIADMFTQAIQSPFNPDTTHIQADA
jgi:hypothetical protein